MKILYLHGLGSKPGGIKPTFLAQHGHEVINPHLPDDDFLASVQIAQDMIEQDRPDVIVGSSRGGGVAVYVESKGVPLVLLCPAWKNKGSISTVPTNTIVIHSRQDDVIPFCESEELLANSGMSPNSIIVVGADHRLADEKSLRTMLNVVDSLEPS